MTARRQHTADAWVVYHHTVSRLLEAKGITPRGLHELHEDLTMGLWRESTIPDGFRVQANALLVRVERLLQKRAEESW